MAEEKHLDILKNGKVAWNTWMKKNWKDLPKVKSYRTRPLLNHEVKNLSLTVADLSELDLRNNEEFVGYNFKRVLFNSCNLSGIRFKDCEFKKAVFKNSDLSNVHFEDCRFEMTDFLDANLSHSIFKKCKIPNANLGKTVLYGTTFYKTTLSSSSLMWAKVIETSFQSSILYRCRVFGASIWNIKLEDTEQKDMIITKLDEIDVTVDNLEIAQFLYLMIRNEKIKTIVETMTSKIVLILGRFTEGRKKVLEEIKNEIRSLGYVPVVFDFQKPDNSDYLEPVLLISQFARFVIADFSDPKIILEEIPKIVDNGTAIIVPIIKKGQREPVTLLNLRVNRLSILDTYHYTNSDELLSVLNTKLLPKAELKLKELQARRMKYTT